MELKGKIAVITGATSGIGLALAKLLLSEGVFCYLIGRNFDQVKSELTALNINPTDYLLIRADLSKDGDLKELVRRIDKVNIHYLIHCAGVITLGELENLYLDSLDKQFAVNVRAPFFITNGLLKRMKASRADIVFVNSTAGLDAWETVGQYAASKHALRAMTDSLRKEVSKDKIRVTSFYLGSVDTPMQQSVQEQYGNVNYDASKYMKPDDIASTIAFILKLPVEVAVSDITIRQNT